MIGGETPTWETATADERKILADIYKRTNLIFRRVGGIPADDPAIAQRVLPVLIDWFPKMADAGHRAEIARCFQYSTARAYVEDLLTWWKQETDELTRGSMTQYVANLTDAENAEKVWETYKNVPEDPFSVFILQKLARYKPTDRRACDEAVRMLREGPPDYAPLEVISRISDPRIRRWFRDRVNDPDPEIRKLSTRVIKRGKPLPLQIERSEEGPDRLIELFSAEVDLRDLGQMLREIEKRTGVRMPAWLRKAEFLDILERDEWVFTDLSMKNETVRIWLRLEDLDVIEIAATPTPRRKGEIRVN